MDAAAYYNLNRRAHSKPPIIISTMAAFILPRCCTPQANDHGGFAFFLDTTLR